MAAPSFFDAYKELFEYEKHVGSEDPVTLSQRDGIGTKTFLDKYCECEQRQALELRAAVPVPFVTTLMVDTSLMRPAPLRFSSTGPPSAFASSTEPSYTAARLSNQDLQHEQLFYRQYSHTQQQQQQQAPLNVRPKTPGMPSLTRSRLESSLRQSVSSNQDDAVAAPTSFAQPMTSALHAPELQRPPHCDSSNNVYTLRHRHVDEAKKIELLIGSNCGGRISAAAATTLPPSIRRRLQASVNAPARREQLYTVLRHDYERLCASH